jgi:hypothetical protein
MNNFYSKVWYFGEMLARRTNPNDAVIFDDSLFLGGDKFSTLHDHVNTAREKNGRAVVSAYDLLSNVIINGDANFDDSGLEIIPNTFEVKGALFLRNLKRLKLPDDYSTWACLVLSGSKIVSLPRNLYVVADLAAENTPLKEIPDDTIVGRTVYVYGSEIVSLPNGLRSPDLDKNILRLNSGHGARHVLSPGS